MANVPATSIEIKNENDSLDVWIVDNEGKLCNILRIKTTSFGQVSIVHDCADVLVRKMLNMPV